MVSYPKGPDVIKIIWGDVDDAFSNIILVDGQNRKLPFLFTKEDAELLKDALNRPGTWESMFKSLLQFLRPVAETDPDPARIDVC